MHPWINSMYSIRTPLFDGSGRVSDTKRFTFLPPTISLETCTLNNKWVPCTVINAPLMDCHMQITSHYFCLSYFFFTFYISSELSQVKTNNRYYGRALSLPQFPLPSSFDLQNLRMPFLSSVHCSSDSWLCYFLCVCLVLLLQCSYCGVCKTHKILYCPIIALSRIELAIPDVSFSVWGGKFKCEVIYWGHYSHFFEKRSL